MERVAGIEPASPAWKAGVITIIRYPHRKLGYSYSEYPFVEKIGTLKKGEKIFLWIPVYIIQKIF